MIYVGIDDTDTIDSRGTGRLARNIAGVLSSKFPIFGVTRHQLFVHPSIPFTSHNSCAVIHAEATTKDIEEIFCTTKKLMLDDFIAGSDPGLALASSSQVTPGAVAFGLDAKTIVVTQERAREVAKNSEIRFEGLGGTNGGIIGAIAGIGLASLKNDGRFLLKGKNRELSGIRSIQEIIDAGIDQILTLQGECVKEGEVHIQKNATPSFIQGKAVLFVEPHEDYFAALKEALDLQFKYKLAAAFAVFGLLILIVFAVQWAYLTQPANTVGGNYHLDETFTQASFLYGPQAWVPYASKMTIMPSVDPNSNGNFYVMFVDLNATSDLNATFPVVRVDYSFSGLHGDAAFHVYGYIKGNGGIQWTNRADGSGANGFYVTASKGSSNTLSFAQPMPDFDNIYVKVSNKEGAAFNDYGNDTYLLKFGKAGGGLNSLHITTEPKNLDGNVTTTSKQSGTFFVDFTGGRVQDDFLLLVAVNGTIGSDFRLNLKSSVPT